MRLTGQISSLFILFLRKNFERTKTLHKQKPTNKTKTSEQKQQRQQFLASTKTSKKGKIVYLRFGAFFTLKLFS